MGETAGKNLCSFTSEEWRLCSILNWIKHCVASMFWSPSSYMSWGIAASSSSSHFSLKVSENPLLAASHTDRLDSFFASRSSIGSRCTIINNWMAYSIITDGVVYSGTTLQFIFVQETSPVSCRSHWACSGMQFHVFHVSNMPPNLSLSGVFTTKTTKHLLALVFSKDLLIIIKGYNTEYLNL